MPKKTLKIDPTQSATSATESSQKPSTQPQTVNTAEEPKAQSSTGTTPQATQQPQQQPPLSDQQKAELGWLAHNLGIPQIAEQVTKLTEAMNALMTGGKPISIAQAATGNPIVDFLKPMFANLDVNKIIDGFMGGGQQETPGVDKDLLNDAVKAARDRENAMRESLTLLNTELKKGAQITRNVETGEIRIGKPTENPAKNA